MNVMKIDASKDTDPSRLRGIEAYRLSTTRLCGGRNVDDGVPTGMAPRGGVT